MTTVEINNSVKLMPKIVNNSTKIPSSLVFQDTDNKEYSITAENDKLKISSDIQFTINNPSPTNISVSEICNNVAPDYQIIYPTGQWDKVDISQTPYEHSYRALCYGKDVSGRNMYVTISTLESNNYLVFYSYNGHDWLSNGAATISKQANGLNIVCLEYGDGYFVGLGSTSHSYFISSDIFTGWTYVHDTNDVLNVSNWQHLRFINGKFYAVSSTSTRNLYIGVVSNNGIVWSVETMMNTSYQLYDIAYGDNKFVACGTNIIAIKDMSVSDPEWTVLNTGLNNNTWRSVVYALNKFVIVANTVKGGKLDRSVVVLRSDGTWIVNNIGTAKRSWYQVAYGNGMFVALANPGDGEEPGTVAAYSTYGENWSVTDIGDKIKWWDLKYGHGGFCCVGEKMKFISNSIDGMDWDQYALPSDIHIPKTWSSICYGRDKYVIATQTEYISGYSYDSTHWIEAEIDINSINVKIGDTIQTITPIDVTNTKDNNKYVPYWTCVAYGHNVYVLISRRLIDDGNRKYSIACFCQDGIHWQPTVISFSKSISSTSGQDLNDDPGVEPYTTYNRQYNCVCYGRDRFIVIQSNTDDQTRYVSNVIAYSLNGMDWTEIAMTELDETNQSKNINGIWACVCYGINMFTILGYAGADSGNHPYPMCCYSEDGINWSTKDVHWYHDAEPGSDGTIREITNDTNGWNWYCICFGYGKYVAASNGTNYGAYSEDGLTWHTTSMSLASSDVPLWRGVCHGNGRFVAIANGSLTAAYSTDGILWNGIEIGTEEELDPSNPKNKQIRSSVCYGNGNFIMPVGRRSYAYIVDMKNKYSPALDRLSQLIMMRLYPVGSIYLSSENTDPSLALGFGSWHRIAGRYLFCNDTAVGTYGGSLYQTLHPGNLPADIISVNATPGQGLPLYKVNATGLGNAPVITVPPHYVVFAWQRIW